MTFKALDLFCGAGGMSSGLERAGFDVTGVDIRDLVKYHRGGTFVQGDALDNTGRRVICVAGDKAMSGGMSEPMGAKRRRAAGEEVHRETFSVDDARAAMGMDAPWEKLPMKYLSQAIPPVYGEWVGARAIRYLERLHA